MRARHITNTKVSRDGSSRVRARPQAPDAQAAALRRDRKAFLQPGRLRLAQTKGLAEDPGSSGHRLGPKVRAVSEESGRRAWKVRGEASPPWNWGGHSLLPAPAPPRLPGQAGPRAAG